MTLDRAKLRELCESQVSSQENVTRTPTEDEVQKAKEWLNDRGYTSLYPDAESHRLAAYASTLRVNGCRITKKEGVACGRWCVNGVPIFALRNRFRAGDTLEFLAEDYGVNREYIEVAIKFYELVAPPEETKK